MTDSQIFEALKPILGIPRNVHEYVTNQIRVLCDDADVPRYRRAFLIDKKQAKENNHPTRHLKDGEVYLVLHGRYGGGNRAEYESDIESFKENAYFVCEQDEDFDYTYGYAFFKVSSPAAEKLLEVYDNHHMDKATDEELINALEEVKKTWVSL